MKTGKTISGFLSEVYSTLPLTSVENKCFHLFLQHLFYFIAHETTTLDEQLNMSRTRKVRALTDNVT